MPKASADKRPRRTDTPAPFKIKDVSEITGISRDTIRYYVNEGLLDPPAKSARNMAWYSDRHIEQLRMIQKLQEEQFLPLKAIKTLVRGTSDLDFSRPQRTVLEDIRHRLSTPRKAADGVGLGELDLTEQELGEFKELGIPLEGEVTDTDLEVARIWCEMREAGLTRERGFGPGILSYLIEVIDLAAQQEISIFQEKIRTMTPDEGRRISEGVIGGLNQIFCLLHQERLGHAIQNALAASQEEPEVED